MSHNHADKGARTLLLNGMPKWPQIIYSKFSSFAIKAMTERLNSLKINLNGSTPESLMYGIKGKDISVKYFHILFCPVYVLDIRLHTAGFPECLKW